MKLQLYLLLVVAGLVPVTFVAAPYPDELVLQHVPTLFILIGLALVVRFVGLSTSSLACILAFMLLHLVGARWIYSFVPYDEWAATLTGRSLSERFGWQRNHYDRLVHLCFGVLGVLPASELLQRFGNMRPRGAALMGVASVLALGGIYEILEWQVAVIFSPAHAEAYNGQQGDPWDAQKDMALQGLGAIVAGLACSSSRALRVRFSSSPPDSLE